MRILLDESVPADLIAHLGAHKVQTVTKMGWGGTRNGLLLQWAARQFDVFVTLDQNIAYQQNPATLPIAVIIASVSNSKISALLPLIPALNHALATIAPRTLVVIGP